MGTLVTISAGAHHLRIRTQVRTDTNVDGALVCIYDASNVGQDGKPLPIEATEDDCELLLGTGKGGDGSGQGDPDTYFANLGEESAAAIEFTDDTNDLAVTI